MGVAWSRGAGEREKGEREGAKREELERGEDMKINVFYRVCFGGLEKEAERVAKR